MTIIENVFCTIIASIASATFMADAIANTDSSGTSQNPFANRIIVKYKDNSSVNRNQGAFQASEIVIQGILSAHGLSGSKLRTMAMGAHVWQVGRALSDTEASALAMEIRASQKDIEYVEQDQVAHPLFIPNDPYFNNQYNYTDPTSGINLLTAWNSSTGAGVVVAVIDTGYRPHVDLVGNIISGYNFISNAAVANDGDGRDGDPTDPGDFVPAGFCASGSPAQSSSWHGTHVSGIVGATVNNGIGVAGVAYGAKVQPVRVLGRCGGAMSDIADAIYWAAGGSVAGAPNNPTPARVLNLSLGAAIPCGPTYTSVINYARSRGSVVVAAAGNNGGAVNSPANCPGVIAVGSISQSGARSIFSNFGWPVALSAPGEYIWSTFNSGSTAPLYDTYAQLSGTSMASPQVAGVAALMLSINPRMSADDVVWKLTQSTRAFPVGCSGCGSGILNAAGAVTAAQQYSPPPSLPFSVSLVSDDGTYATWSIVNNRSAPMILEKTGAVVNGSIFGGLRFASTTCTDGSLVPAGGSSTVVTVDGSACGGAIYWLTATNSAGVAQSSDWATSSNESCGGC